MLKIKNYIFIFLIFITCPVLHSEESVDVIFCIKSFPIHTPKKEAVFITGNFNNWNPGDKEYKLKQNERGKWQIKMEGRLGEVIQFKFTRGDWETVEKAADGSEMKNRRYKFTKNKKKIKFNIKNWRDFVENIQKHESTVIGNVKIIKNFYIPQLDRKRSLRIYLPPDYERSNKNYPVIYMHDGQNLFDAATSFAGEWQVDETLERFYEENKSAAYIVVGVDNSGKYRLDEYSPWKTKRNKAGEGFAYIDFIVNTLKPYIDNAYRTKSDRTNTAIVGSSMGGLISLVAVTRYPNIFSKAGVFSPSVWFAKEELLHWIRNFNSEYELKIYLDMGTEETDKAVDEIDEVYQKLLDCGIEKKNLKLVIDRGAKHNEYYWAKRFPSAIRWLFKI